MNTTQTGARKCMDCNELISPNQLRCAPCQRVHKKDNDRKRALEVKLGLRLVNENCKNRMEWVAPFFLCAGCGKMRSGRIGNLRRSEYCAECKGKVDFSTHQIIGDESGCYVRVQDAVIVSEVRVVREHVTPIVAAVLKGYRSGW